MIRMIRYIGINLWVSTLFFVPLVFWILPRLASVFPDVSAGSVAAAVFTACFVVIFGLVDFLAGKMIARLLVEGQTWEHSGIYKKAEKAYTRAIRVYDTFGLLPLINHRLIQDLCAAIARFTAAGKIRNPGFDLTTRIYLKRSPEDEDVAGYWLERLNRKGEISHADQSILSLLAQYHYSNPRLIRLLADIFIRLDRKDFAAVKLFRYLAENEPDLALQYQDRFNTLTEEFESTPASMAGIEEPGIDKPLRVKEKRDFIQVISSAYRETTRRLNAVISIIVRITGLIAVKVKQIMALIKENRKARSYLKMLFFAVVFAWLVFFMINTIAHLFKSKPVPEQIKEEVKKAVPKPFTIQVAAYLKQVHADRYVNTLKRKGIDASVKKVDGGGKSWYLVRVSEFEDKQSAEAYGDKLKQQKIIDDYFVNNK